jgi:beta-carotene hydroxylase
MSREISVAVTTDDDAKTAMRAFETSARDVVADLTGRFAWRTVIVFFGVLAAATAVGVLAATGRLSYWVAIPLNAIIIYFIFAPLHEAVHANIAGRHQNWRWLELAIGHISGFVLLAPYPGFRRLHLHHHQHTNDPAEDPDYWVKSNNYLTVILRCLVIQPVYIWHLYRVANDPVGKRAFRDEMIMIALYPPVIAAAYLAGWGTDVMLLWVLSGYFGVVLCPLMFDWPVHHPHTERGRYTDSAILLFPRSVRPIVDFAFGGHCYHLMHHLYPRIPFYDYGTAYYALEGGLAKIGAKVRRFEIARKAA